MSMDFILGAGTAVALIGVVGGLIAFYSHIWWFLIGIYMVLTHKWQLMTSEAYRDMVAETERNRLNAGGKPSRKFWLRMF